MPVADLRCAAQQCRLFLPEASVCFPNWHKSMQQNRFVVVVQEGGEWVPSQANFTSLATPNAVGSGKTALNTLLHEGK